jgi:N-methylhydantoinase A/oxoprolinase/acetone carboxylase beta subunit
MVCGDCTEIELDRAIHQSASTFASGPAATAWFGSRIAVNETVLVVDMGGTTTDITLVAHGKPVMDTTGMTIGSWQTHVQAVEMFTVGVGGDSLFTPLGRDNNSLGPSRVIPLCQADQHIAPQDLGRLTEAIGQLGPKLESSLVMVADPQSSPDSPLVAWLADQGPTTPEAVLQYMGQGEIALEKELAHLLKTRAIMQTGFTPTDALHCLQHIAMGNTHLAMLGARVMGTCLGMDARTMSHLVLSLARDKIATTILDYVAGREVNQGLSSFLHSQDNPLLEITVRLKPPIIGIGACSRHVLPQVAQRLGTTIVFPDNFDVGNAVGAAWLGLDKGNP